MASIGAQLPPSTAHACCNVEEPNVRGLGGLELPNLLGKFHKRCFWRFPMCSRSRARGSASVMRSRAKAAADLQSLAAENASSRATVEIPVTCYQLVGVPDKAEKDEIVKSVMQLKAAEIEEGYSMDAVVSRQELLMDLRDKLLFEPEYAGNIKEKVPPKGSLLIPWNWLPGAICLLQEVGEVKLALDIGCRLLHHPDAKPYIHDLLLSMALAECAIAKISLEKNKVSQGFEALARAQSLLRSRSSLGRMTLLSQIEESLEELAPACTLEILGMPRVPENAERRQGAIAALGELLRQGLDVETSPSRQVQDWPGFLIQAFTRIMASEIIELLPWDTLAATRKNKKSMESQNQRVVIDFHSFYTVLLAHIALGFSRRQLDLISEALAICESLIASDGVDLAFVEAFCLHLLGKAEETEAFEKLQELKLNSTSASRNTTSDSGTNQSLETWLRDSVLGVFPDTRDCSPSLVSFFGAGKRTLMKKERAVASKTTHTVNHRPVRTNVGSDVRAVDDLVRYPDSSQHFGSAVKQLAPANLHNPLTSYKNTSGMNSNSSSFQLNRSIGARHDESWKSWCASRDAIGRIIFAAALGCIVFATFRLSRMKLWRTRTACEWNSMPNMKANSLSWTTHSFFDHGVIPACEHKNPLALALQKLLLMVKVPLKNHPEASKLQSSWLPASLSSSTAMMRRRPMPCEEAEALVKNWQAIKAEALGPRHHVSGLYEVLDESMLVQWQSLADAAKERSCFWRFVLLQLSVLRADIFLDKGGAELADIEALLEEAAELVDESQHKNPNYYSTYKIHYMLKRQDDGSWRFCECEIQR